MVNRLNEEQQDGLVLIEMELAKALDFMGVLPGKGYYDVRSSVRTEDKRPVFVMEVRKKAR